MRRKCTTLAAVVNVAKSILNSCVLGYSHLCCIMQESAEYRGEREIRNFENRCCTVKKTLIMTSKRCLLVGLHVAPDKSTMFLLATGQHILREQQSCDYLFFILLTYVLTCIVFADQAYCTNTSKKRTTFSRFLRGLKTSHRKEKHGGNSPRHGRAAATRGVPQRVSIFIYFFECVFNLLLGYIGYFVNSSISFRNL